MSVSLLCLSYDRSLKAIILPSVDIRERAYPVKSPDAPVAMTAPLSVHVDPTKVNDVTLPESVPGLSTREPTATVLPSPDIDTLHPFLLPETV